MSAHIYTSTPSETLTSATAICKKHKIYHSTLQIENVDDNVFNTK